MVIYSFLPSLSLIFLCSQQYFIFTSCPIESGKMLQFPPHNFFEVFNIHFYILLRNVGHRNPCPPELNVTLYRFLIIVFDSLIIYSCLSHLNTDWILLRRSTQYLRISLLWLWLPVCCFVLTLIGRFGSFVLSLSVMENKSYKWDSTHPPGYSASCQAFTLSSTCSIIMSTHKAGLQCVWGIRILPLSSPNWWCQ